VLINTDVGGFQALRPRIEPGEASIQRVSADKPKLARCPRWIKSNSAGIREYLPGRVLGITTKAITPVHPGKAGLRRIDGTDLQRHLDPDLA
jgi:hypothetical protein